jgi:DNA-binding CsgD family transcriptional regulator
MDRPFVLLDAALPTAAVSVLELGRAYVLGRSTECHIVLADATVSRRHAAIAVAEATARVRDLGSSNGTFIDEQRVGQAPLTVGRRLRLGNVCLLFTRTGVDDALPDSDVETPPVGSHNQSAARTTISDSAARLLSRAQRRVYQLLLEGLQEKTIACRLDLSPHTVHNHVRTIYALLGVHSHPELVAAHLRHGDDPM